jgi:ribonuclease HI
MIKVWFDGACWPNPGGRASYGWAASKEGYFHKEGSGIIGNGPSMSNNVAEYTALYESLRWLKENNYSKEKITCYGDSKLVIEQMSKRWRVKKGLYIYAFKQTFCMAEEFPSIRFIWIPREKNTLADYLSKHLLNIPYDDSRMYNKNFRESWNMDSNYKDSSERLP